MGAFFLCDILRVMDAELTTIQGQGLNEQEQELLYNVEVLRVPVRRAGEMAGVTDPYAMLKRPAVMVARDKLRVELRGNVKLTREDVIAGLMEAIEHARVMGDALPQIAGWREISKMLGYDKTPNVNIHIQGNLDQVRRQMQGLPMDQLLREAGQENIIDADFYRAEG